MTRVQPALPALLDLQALEVPLDYEVTQAQLDLMAPQVQLDLTAYKELKVTLEPRAQQVR